MVCEGLSLVSFWLAELHTVAKRSHGGEYVGSARLMGSSQLCRPRQVLGADSPSPNSSFRSFSISHRAVPTEVEVTLAAARGIVRMLDVASNAEVLNAEVGRRGARWPKS